jgi:hypothetical protein
VQEANARVPTLLTLAGIVTLVGVLAAPRQ